MSYYTYTCTCTQSGTFALMEAAREGQTKIVADLLKAGANLNLENSVCNKYNIHCGRYTYMYV